MIIDDLCAFRRALAPSEADPPLIVNPDTILTLPTARERLEPVPGNRRHILQLPGVIQHTKLPPRHLRNAVESAAPLPFEEFLRFRAPERSNHTLSISRHPFNEER
jgi:hypothetical protein